MLLSKRSLFFSTFVILLVFAGVMRIVATYHIFNHTWDEPVHFTAGLEWLDLGTYTYEAQHPPLVRIAIALGPFLSGIRISEDQREFLHNARREIRVRPLHWTKRYMNAVGGEGKRILYDSESYWQTLSLARLGVLPFFFLATIVVGVWSRKLFGNAAGLASVALFTTLPPILAHAGLATLDMGVTALLLTFLFLLILLIFTSFTLDPFLFVVFVLPVNKTLKRKIQIGVKALAFLFTKNQASSFLCSVSYF